jgi:hypothetical protein
MGNNYSTALKMHLSQYKVARMGVSENGVWRKNGQQYSHILPFQHQKLNILEPFRQLFWDYFAKAGITLHRDFHHLTSSQAMCFNLFFPFMSDGNADLQLLPDVLGMDKPISNPRFEFILNSIEGTNFDFCLNGRGARYLFEVKLTEPNFGTTKRDDTHKKKFEEVYQPRLAVMLQDPFCSCEFFLKHYQLMRNVWNLTFCEADRLFLVVPRANLSATAKLALLETCLPESYRRRVTICFLEDVVRDIDSVTASCGLKEHFRLFREKYLPRSMASSVAA